MENEDLKYLKKHYGEKFAHLCRDLFPTLLENEGLLKKLITDRFPPSRELYNDIVENSLQNNFKNYIYSFIDVEAVYKEIVTLSPEELLDKAGYKLYPECKTEEDIQSFKKYYVDDEKLCTFYGGRLDSCRVWFAVKKNVKDIKREDFKNPSRQDEYGTSVISIQFTKTKPSTLSIKNRYNHRVNNPDATFGNNLDNIIEGLTQAFIQKYKINLLEDESKNLELPNYKQATNGKFYKYTIEENNTYYCTNNVIIEHGKAKTLDKQKYLLFEGFILDIENKRLYSYDKNINDAFCESVGEIKDIKRLPSDKGLTIELTPKEGEVVKIELNKNNEIVGYTNLNIREIGDFFLYNNKKIERINMPNLKSIKKYFLYRNENLEEINFPNLENVEDGFLYCNEKLTKLELFNLHRAKNSFLYGNEALKTINLPNLESVGDDFLYYNQNLQDINLPNLKSVGDSFLDCNIKLTKLNLPNLQKAGCSFLCSNEQMRKLNLPNLESVEDEFLYYNKKLKDFKLPKLQSAGDYFLYYNENLESITLPKLQIAGYGFLNKSENLKEINIPKQKDLENKIKIKCKVLDNDNLDEQEDERM